MSGSEIIEIIGSAQKMWYQPLLKFEGLYKISA